MDLGNIDAGDVPDNFTPDMADWWDGGGQTFEAATGMVGNMKAAGANDDLVAVMVWLIGLSMLIGVLRRAINTVVTTGAQVVDREHSLSVERRRKTDALGPYYIPPTPGQVGIDTTAPTVPAGYEETK
ncbi:hypothetical protein [Hyphomonas sp. UBA4494]|jgi:hypothetical protein|uniref:hypothetical protein n=1 Tax=Hyphomonas sp. UBA4494 TaxID=1946631 RepID=UPI0025C007F7|nr:hypothetical protein [Hyphomonas sp. UBA4494]